MERWIILALIIIGIGLDIYFIRTEYAKKMLKATVLKGMASLFFVLLGGYLYSNHVSTMTRLIFIGLIFGMLGDIFLNMRNLYKGKTSNKVFAIGILFFLTGHFLYIAALMCAGKRIVILSLGLTLIIGVIAIPTLMKRITAPSKGLKIFGYVYLTVVIAMFSFALALFIKAGTMVMTVLFVIGAGLFVVSDFIMIYYSFGKKIPPLRAINLLTYYFGQIMIALSIMYMI